MDEGQLRPSLLWHVQEFLQSLYMNGLPSQCSNYLICLLLDLALILLTRMDRPHFIASTGRNDANASFQDLNQPSLSLSSVESCILLSRKDFDKGFPCTSCPTSARDDRYVHSTLEAYVVATSY
jgi:hypothetical protein